MNHLSDPTAPIKATCHCGAITVTAPGHPDKPLNECQCTLCRRYAVAWAYYNTTEVQVDIKPGASMGKYSWGFNSASFDWCNGCGCLMFWWPLEVPEGGKMMGLNTRMVEPDALKGVSRVVEYEGLFQELPQGCGSSGKEGA